MKTGSWAKEEVDYLRASLGRLSVRQQAEHLQRPYRATLVKLSRLGFKSPQRAGMFGETNPQWAGNVRKQISYTTAWHKEIKYQVYDRDSYTCQQCGIVPIAKQLKCHHIVRFRLCQNNDLRNQVTLCSSCHRRQRAHYWRPEEYLADPKALIATLLEYQCLILDSYVPLYVATSSNDSKIEHRWERIEANLFERTKTWEGKLCEAGHPMTPENTFTKKEGRHPRCRFCYNKYQRSRRATLSESTADPS